MSTYCTQAQMEDKYGEETLRRHADYDEDGTADADSVDRAITDSSALMDSYFAVLYAVPLVPIPDVVRACCIDLTMCNLALGRNSMTEDLEGKCEKWQEWLEAVAAGTAVPGAVAPPASASAPGVRHEAEDRLFGRAHSL